MIVTFQIRKLMLREAEWLPAVRQREDHWAAVYAHISLTPSPALSTGVFWLMTHGAPGSLTQKPPWKWQGFRSSQLPFLAVRRLRPLTTLVPWLLHSSHTAPYPHVSAQSPLCAIVWAGLQTLEGTGPKEARGSLTQLLLVFFWRPEKHIWKMDRKVRRSKKNGKKKTKDCKSEEDAHPFHPVLREISILEWSEGGRVPTLVPQRSRWSEILLALTPYLPETIRDLNQERFLSLDKALCSTRSWASPSLEGLVGQQLSGPWAYRGDSSWNLLSLSTVATLLLSQALILPPRPTHCHLLWEVFPACPVSWHQTLF